MPQNCPQARYRCPRPGQRLRPIPKGRADQASAVSTSAGDALKSGLLALGSKNAALARGIRNSLPRNALDRHILTWSIVLSGAEDVPSEEIAEAASELKGWPGLASLPGLFERALFFEQPSPQKVLAAFRDKHPETTKGTITLVRALMESGDAKRARTIAAKTWRTEMMDDREAGIFLDEFGSLLSKSDHFRRMEMLLYRDHVNDAKEVARKAEAYSLYRAWSDVIRNPATASGAIKAVDPSWHKTPSLFVSAHSPASRTRAQQGSCSTLGKNAQGPCRTG